MRQFTGLEESHMAYTRRPASGKLQKQPLTMLFDVFQQYPAAMPIWQPSED